MKLKKDKANRNPLPNEFINKFRISNFQEIPKYEIDKICWKFLRIYKSNSNYKFFIYNPEIGLSFRSSKELLLFNLKIKN